MILPEIRHIQSAELEPPNLPADPADCEVGFQALIGPKDGEGQEVFRFTVLTAARISSFAEGQWGRGKLILPAFDWATVVRAWRNCWRRAHVLHGAKWLRRWIRSSCGRRESRVQKKVRARNHHDPLCQPN